MTALKKERSDGRGQTAFLKRYGPWAIVAGASRGLGEAFARLLAGRGFKLALAARGREPLEALAESLRKEYGVEVVTHAVDLASGGAELEREIETREVGLLVYNAAYVPAGAFLGLAREDHERVLAVNCRTPLLLARAAAARMRERGRGGIVLVSLARREVLRPLPGRLRGEQIVPHHPRREPLVRAQAARRGRDGADVRGDRDADLLVGIGREEIAGAGD